MTKNTWASVWWRAPKKNHEYIEKHKKSECFNKYFHVLSVGTEMFTWHMKKFRSSKVKNRKAPTIYICCHSFEWQEQIYLVFLINHLNFIAKKTCIRWRTSKYLKKSWMLYENFTFHNYCQLSFDLYHTRIT